MSPMSKIVIATHNPGKLEEFEALFSPLGIDAVGAAALGLEVPAETEVSFERNAALKARAAVAATGLPCLSDDSGLEVDALGGLPGVWSADWAERHGGRDFNLAMARVHEAIVKSGAPKPWRARFVCCLFLARPDGADKAFFGVVDGQIVSPGRGANGHGYDPIFLPDGSSQTYGEINRWTKNKDSHRARALRLLLRECFT